MDSSGWINLAKNRVKGWKYGAGSSPELGNPCNQDESEVQRCVNNHVIAITNSWLQQRRDLEVRNPASQIEHDSATQNAVAWVELITLLPASRGILAHFEVLEKKLHQELLDGGCNIYLRSDLEPALGSRLNKILSFFHVNDTPHHPPASFP